MASARPSSTLEIAKLLDQHFPDFRDEFTISRSDGESIRTIAPTEVKEVPPSIQEEFNRIKQMEPDLIAAGVSKFNETFSPWHINHTRTNTVDTAENEKDLLTLQKMAEALGMSAFLEKAYAETLATRNVDLLKEAGLNLMFSYVNQWLEKKPQLKKSFQEKAARLKDNHPDRINPIFVHNILRPALLSYHTQLSQYGVDLTQEDIRDSAAENCTDKEILARAEAFLKDLMTSEPAKAAAAPVKSLAPGYS